MKPITSDEGYTLWILETSRGRKRAWTKTKKAARAKAIKAGLKVKSIRQGTVADLPENMV